MRFYRGDLEGQSGGGYSRSLTPRRNSRRRDEHQNEAKETNAPLH